MVSMKVLGVAMTLTIGPATAFADFCDIISSGASQACRSKAQSGGSVIIGSWLRLKPELAIQPITGTKSYFVSGTTPALETLGTTSSRRPMLTVDCFAKKRTMRMGALPYMLGLANGSNKAFTLAFNVDAKPQFTEIWSLDWQHAELRAPEGSQLANELQRSAKLTVKTEGVLGRKSPVGYVFDTRGFDQMNAGLCR